jgi:redox-sensing transcriptional repressor
VRDVNWSFAVKLVLAVRFSISHDRGRIDRLFLQADWAIRRIRRRRASGSLKSRPFSRKTIPFPNWRISFILTPEFGRPERTFVNLIDLSSDKGSNSENVPKAVVSRLSLYLRELQQLMRAGKETISSTRLGKLLGITDAQVRKDIANFGQFGSPGVGYRCEQLVAEIRRILGTNRMWPVALVGCGNMGQALLGYRGFVQQGFSVVAAFDVNPSIVGTKIGGIVVDHFDTFGEIAKANQIQMAILAVPAEYAQSVAEDIIKSGISGILNFAPMTLNLPPHIEVVGVDLAIELEQLSFAVAKQPKSN